MDKTGREDGMSAAPKPYGTLSDRYAAGTASIKTATNARANVAPLALRPARLPQPNEIAPRQWLYGRVLIRGYITVLVAPGGVGKTAWAMGCACSMAIGRGLINDWVYQPEKVLVCTLEDPEDEFDRRLAAMRLHHEIEDGQLKNRIFVVSGRDRRLLIAGIAEDGFTVCYPDKDALVEQVKAAGIGVIIVDPFVNSHELDENNNPHINAAARAWAEIANEANCAVLLVHHTRKGAEAGDIESSRGAKALTDACRVGLTLTPMTKDEADGFGVSERDRRLHVRLDDAKANLAPPSEKARWFKLQSVALNNGLPNTPWHEGDNVQAIETWEPPETWTHSVAELNHCLDQIAKGPGKGQLYSTRRSGAGGGSRWCGTPLMETLEVEEGRAAKMVKTWLANKVLEEREYTDPVQRKSRQGVFVVDGNRPQ